MEMRKTVDGQLYWAVIGQALKDGQYLLINRSYRPKNLHKKTTDQPSRLESFMALRWLMDNSDRYKIDRDFIAERAGIDGDWLRDRCREAAARGSFRKLIIRATNMINGTA